MLFSLCEEIVSEYFERKGFVVLRNIPYPVRDRTTERTKPGNQEIDIVAYRNTGGNEVHFISCKRGALNQKEVEKEVYVLKTATDHFKNDSQYSWMMEGDPSVNYHYIAEVVRSEQKMFDDIRPEIKVKVNDLSTIVEDYIRSIANEMGPNLNDGNESQILPRLIKFLIQHSNTPHKRRTGREFTDLEHIDFENIRLNLKGKRNDLKDWLDENSSIV